MNFIHISLIFLTSITFPVFSDSNFTCGPTEIETKRVVGYWQGKRNLVSKQVNKMTHLNYAFIPMHANGSVILRNHDITRINWMKNAKSSFNPNLKIMFSIGGSNSQYFSSVLADPNSIELFITSILNIIQTYNLDGVDIDWEFPQNDSDKNNFVQLMQRLCLALEDLRASLARANRYVLSFASGYDKWSLARGFDLPKLIQVVDFINVMTYDYYAAWEAPSGCITGPSAPLYGGWWFLSENVDSTMKFYACTTQQIKKLNLGIPFYGRYWNNVPNLYFNPLHRAAVSANGGNCEGDAIAWRDIPTSWNLNETTFHEISLVPYIYDTNSSLPGGRFLGFENPESISHKVNYTINNNIGGISIWALDHDDDNYQMIQAVIQRVDELPNNDTIVYSC